MLSVCEGHIRDESALDEAARLWLDAVKKGNVENEILLRDVFDLMNVSVSNYELNYNAALLEAMSEM